MPAHRMYYESLVGPVPDDLQLDHLCRNTCCVNPSHLEPVTAAENTRRGSSAKLTVAQVQEIRAAEDSQRTIAARYGISQSQVSQIKSRKVWAAA